MFRRWIALCAAVLMFAALAVPTVSARAAETTFTLAANDAEVGETVTVTVSITENSYFTNATIYLYYNTEALQFVEDSQATGSVSSSQAMFMAADHPDKGYVKSAYVAPDTKSVKKAGVLLQFEFEVLQKTTSEFTLGFDECIGVDENGADFDVAYVTFGCIINNVGTETTSPPVTSPLVTGTVTVPTTAATSTGGTVSGDDTHEVTNPNGETVTNTGDENNPSHLTTTPADSPGAAQTVVTNENGEIVSNPTDSSEELPETTQNNMWVMWGVGIGIVLLCVFAAVAIAVVAIVVRKKKNDTPQ